MAQRSSYKKPWLYTEPQRAMQTTMEGEIYNEGAVEKQSQWKKPYRHQFHPESEWAFAGPGFGPHGWNSGFPSGADCEPQGSAIGGGEFDPCLPEISCGQWTWNCAHKITKFNVIQSNGWIQSIVYGPNDTVTVTVCWDESFTEKGGALGTLVTTASGAVFESKIDVDCKNIGEGADEDCTECEDCPGDEYPPVISYQSQQMQFNGTQSLSATGGGGAPYRWTLSGGGSLSKLVTSAGKTTIYTAPSSNPECAYNPTIIVTDYCGNTASVKLAVSCTGLCATGLGYRKENWANNLLACMGQWASGCTQYNCANSYVNSLSHCSGTNILQDARDLCDGSSAYWCLYEDGTCQTAPTYPDYDIIDKRTAAQKTNGCCPAGLL